MTAIIRAYVCLLMTMTAVLMLTGPAYAQGSISGEVRNGGGVAPASENLSFFGYLRGTDTELRLYTSDGAGYDAGFWFDDFQNFLDEAPGVEYSYYFFDILTGEYAHLNAVVPNNSFEVENVQLAATLFPAAPAGLALSRQSASTVRLTWQGVPGCVYHVYRREASSNGSFYRIDDPTGTIDVGVSDPFYVDVSAPDDKLYHYILICRDDMSRFSPLSNIITSEVSSCCVGLTGNVDADTADAVDIADLTLLIDHLFIANTPLPCPAEGNTDGDELGAVDIGDLTILIDYLFISRTPPAPCQ